MGLFDLFKKKQEPPTVSVRLVVCDADGNETSAADEENERRRAREYEEDLRRRIEIQASNRAFLEEHGVDVRMFTMEKALADALEIVELTCGPMTRFDHGLRHEVPTFGYCSPTKTGKLPKNVVSAHVSHEVVEEKPSGVPGFTIPAYGDSLSVSLDYLADGRVNKADLNGRHEDILLSVSVRRSGGALRITGGWITHLTSDDGHSLFPGDIPEDAAEAVAVLGDEVSRIYGRS